MKNQIIEALQNLGYKVIYVKGVFIFENGERLSRAQAMKLAGLKAKSQQVKSKQKLYGDFAWIAAINRIKS